MGRTWREKNCSQCWLHEDQTGLCRAAQGPKSGQITKDTDTCWHQIDRVPGGKSYEQVVGLPDRGHMVTREQAGHMDKPLTWHEAWLVVIREIAREFVAQLIEQKALAEADAVKQIAALQRELGEARGRLEEVEARLEGKAPKIDLSQIPTAGTCWTCQWFSGKICHRVGSPHHSKRVSPLDKCEQYTFTPKKRRLATLEKGTSQKRPRATCDTCGGVFAVSGKGLHPHDVNGVAFVAGRGDRSRPCPGKPKEGKDAG